MATVLRGRPDAVRIDNLPARKGCELSELRTEPVNTGGARPVGRARLAAFYVLVGLFTLMLLFMSPLQFVVLGWFLEEAQTHRVHEISFGFVFVLSLVGVLAQLRKPAGKIAQMWQTAIPIWLVIVAIILIGEEIDPIVLLFLVVPGVLMALHPGRSLLFHRATDPSRLLAAMTVVAAVPLLIFAVGEFRIGQDAAAVAGDVEISDDESIDEVERKLRAAGDTPEEKEAAVHYGHWSAMAAFAVGIASLGALAALKLPGWRVPAWGAGLAAVIYGVVSLAYPEDASAANSIWAALAILWGVGFIGVAEVEARSRPPAPA
jgi:hypothetical protein